MATANRDGRQVVVDEDDISGLHWDVPTLAWGGAHIFEDMATSKYGAPKSTKMATAGSDHCMVRCFNDYACEALPLAPPPQASKAASCEQQNETRTAHTVEPVSQRNGDFFDYLCQACGGVVDNTENNSNSSTMPEWKKPARVEAERDLKNWNAGISKEMDLPSHDGGSRLHEMCLISPQDHQAIHDAIREDIFQALTPRRCPICHYSYPLHIAIYQKASLEVLQILVEVGPLVLLQEDGPLSLTPLSLALATHPQEVNMHTFLLAKDALPVRMPNARCRDLPLHIACQHCAPPVTLTMLVLECRQAVFEKNSNGLSPCDIVVGRPSFANSQILDVFLQFGTWAD